MRTILFSVLSLFQSLVAQEVMVVSEQGETISFDIASHLPLQYIMDEASLYLANGTGSSGHYDLYITNVSMNNQSLAATVGRDYSKAVTAQQIQDINYISHTLATAPLKKLLADKSSLKKAGNRIDVIHPLRFL